MPASPLHPLETLQRRLAYDFRNPRLLERAVTHPSLLQERPDLAESNQRLEFLGDAVLQLVLTEALFEIFPGDREGGLSKRRAALANGAFLAQLAREIELEFCLRLGASEESTGGRARAGARSRTPSKRWSAPSISTAISQRHAAWFLDSTAIYRGDSPWWRTSKIPRAGCRSWCSRSTATAPLRYEVVHVAGEDHAREYEVARLPDRPRARLGPRPIEKLAEEAAARVALAVALEGDPEGGRRPRAPPSERCEEATAPGGRRPPFCWIALRPVPAFLLFVSHARRDLDLSATSSPASARRIRAAVVAELCRAHPAPVWLVVVEDLECRRASRRGHRALRHRLQQSRDRTNCWCFPNRCPTAATCARRLPPPSDRLTVLSRACAPFCGLHATPDTCVVVTTPAALLQPVPALEEFATRELILTRGQTQPFQGPARTTAKTRLRRGGRVRGAGTLCHPRRPDRRAFTPSPPTCPIGWIFLATKSKRSGNSIPSPNAPAPTWSASRLPRRHASSSIPPRPAWRTHLNGGARLVFIEPAALEEEFSAFASAEINGLAALLDKGRAAAFGVSDLDEANGLFDAADDEMTWDSESLAHHRRYPAEALVAHERLHVEDEARGGTCCGRSPRGRKRDTTSPSSSRRRAKSSAPARFSPATRAPKGLRPRWLRGTLNEGFRITFREGAILSMEPACRRFSAVRP